MKPFIRQLATALSVLLLGAAFVFHIGGKQFEYQVETVIEGTTVEQVRSILTNPVSQAEWNKDFVYQREQDKDQQKTVGATAQIVVKEEGREAELKNEYLATSDSSLTVKTISDDTEDVTVWKFVDEGDLTVRIRRLTIANFKGWHRFKAPFNKQGVEAQFQKDLARLKRFIETGSPEEPRNQAASEDATNG